VPQNQPRALLLVLLLPLLLVCHLVLMLSLGPLLGGCVFLAPCHHAAQQLQQNLLLLLLLLSLLLLRCGAGRSRY
jgi:hypothetical protein